MFYELEPNRFAAITPLLDTMKHNLSPAAVVDGICPGRVWVDNSDSPRTALIDTPEGHFVAGGRPAGQVAASLKQLVTGTIYARGRAEDWWCFCLHYPEPDWQETLAGLLGETYPVWDYQQYFILERLRLDWREGLPAGFVVRRVDEDLLADDGLANVNRLRGYATSNFGSLAGFAANGFGFCTVYGQEIASWCMADCVSADRCEIGIHTVEKDRRRGLAARTVAATIEYCLSQGLKHIGWHCWSSNLASAATARAVGFVKALDHCGVHAWFNECDGLLVDGNLHLLREQYADAAERYERAFSKAASGDGDAPPSRLLSQRTDQARYRYKAACAYALAGDVGAAQRHLDEAPEAGTERWMLF
ncbi:MAG: GNAT family N-acetyltransferase [Armatimonadota bacterium]